MVRVLHVLDHSWPILDGYCQRSRSIVRAQRELGLEPAVVTGTAQEFDDSHASEIVLDSVGYYRTAIGGGLGGYAIRKRILLIREHFAVRRLRKRIQDLLEETHFDVVHAHSPALCGLAAAQAAKSCSIPFVYEIRSFWEDSAVDQGKTTHMSLRYRLGRLLETRVVNQADAVVGISQAILNDLKSRGVPESKLFHVPNGVDATRFTPREKDAALAAELGVDGVPTLGYIGTLFPWEGIPWLVRAASHLHGSGLNFKLLLAGDGLAAGDVRRSIQECDAGSYVQYLGRVPHEQIERFYSVMDVLVYPRRKARVTEVVTPLKPLEAMALGKAVLGSSVGGIRELIEPQRNGLLFQAENVEDFCRQASRLLGDATLRSRLGEEARRTINQEKDWSALGRRYQDLYNYVTKRPTRQ
jgi:glycogen synthase